MSMQQAILDTFDEKLSSSYPDVKLTSPDINRIVSIIVQTFTVEKGMDMQMYEHIENYVQRYKVRANKRDCGCKKK